MKLETLTTALMLVIAMGISFLSTPITQPANSRILNFSSMVEQSIASSLAAP